MTIEHWNRAEVFPTWDVVFLGGSELPGVAKVTVSLSADIDTKKPKGAKRGSIVDNGDKLSKVRITLQLEEDRDLEVLQKQLANLRPRARVAARDPLEIVHPNPNFWGITAIVIQEIEAPHPSAVDGWELSIDCLEWTPEPVEVKPAGKGKAKPKDESSAWLPYRDDDVAGSGAPAANDSALTNLGLPDSRAD